jgi:hypothetical protein
MLYFGAEKKTKTFGYFLQFLINFPKKIGENSPNLATLAISHICAPA